MSSGASSPADMMQNGSSSGSSWANDSAHQPSPSPRRRGCNCKKSGCLKLYCECFAANRRCGDRCQCAGCKNKEHNRLEIAHAIQTIEKRTQKAFRSPIAVARKLDSLRSMPTESTATSSSEDLTALKHDGRHMTREVCGCRGGICTSECHCLSRFGGCDVNCPCKGCQPLPQEKTKGCSCKKSNCLKLYCECLAAQRICDERCNCKGCKNHPDHRVERERAITAILERNPLAFQPKVASGSSQHLRGCNCRKSGCMKNYCECHQAGVACTSRCACLQCRNTEMFVSAKKMLVFSAAESRRKEQVQQPQPRSGGKTAKRQYRRVSYTQRVHPQTPPTHSHPHPYQPTPLELLSRSAPSAQPEMSVGDITPSQHRDGSAFPHTTDRPTPAHSIMKRKYNKATTRRLFMERGEDISTAAGIQLPPPEDSFRDEEGGKTESSLMRLCQSLLHAAMSVESSVEPQQTGEIAATATASSGNSASPAVQGNGPLSPGTESLMCSEDIDQLSSQERLDEPDNPWHQQHKDYVSALAAVQERAVLQELNVWLRSMSTANASQ